LHFSEKIEKMVMMGLNGNIGPCGDSEVKMVMMVVYGQSLAVKLAMGYYMKIEYKNLKKKKEK
jgi:hypothetical protein